MLRPTDYGGPCSSYFRWAVCDRLSWMLVKICNESWSIVYGLWDENWKWGAKKCLIYRSASTWSPDFTETSYRGPEEVINPKGLTIRSDWDGLNILHRSKWDVTKYSWKEGGETRRRSEMTKFGWTTTTTTKYSFLTTHMSLEMHMHSWIASGDVWSCCLYDSRKSIKSRVWFFVLILFSRIEDSPRETRSHGLWS